MELTDPLSIAGLIAGHNSPGRHYARRDDSCRHGKPLLTRRRSCQCGTCPTCLDNAKWERIFRDKFADPDYYKPRPANCGSSLGTAR